MAKHSITANWKKGMAFEADIMGHTIRMDAGEEVGGKDSGVSPKPLMLLALAGCTGMDVVSILKKMKVEFEDLKISVEGDLTEEHPKQYSAMKLIYEFKGTDLPMEKLEKAINMSQEKYCGVSALYQKAIDVSHEIRVV